MSRMFKPIEIKRRHGAHIRKDVVPVTVLDKIPKPPSYFKNSEQRALWKQTCQAMLEMGVLTVQSLSAVETHVHAMMTMRSVMSKPNQASHNTRTLCIEAARRSASELGLSPSSHPKLRKPVSVPRGEVGKNLTDMVS